MLRLIDSVLNRITMYRLVLYYLLLLLLFAAIFGYLGWLPYSPAAIILSASAFTAFCWIVNRIFAVAFKAPVNVESVYITALILALIVPPPTGLKSGSIFAFVLWASVWAIASKFILAIGKKHIFNPAAFAVFLTGSTLGLSATWWVGNVYMLPVVLIGGFLMVRKISRWDLVLSFLIAAFATIIASTVLRGGDVTISFQKTITDSAIFFFAFVMLTEPLTTPPTRNRRIVYGLLVGVLFAPAIHFGDLYSTPELALLIGNVLSYLLSPKKKLILKLKERINIGPGLYDFVFVPDGRMNFTPGQYLEWTLGHDKPDSRGNRRFFTIASAPTEKEIRLGVKFYDNPSSFKSALMALKPGDTMVASQLAGDFVLPKKKEEKVVLIAGGIGVTPFRSMIKDAVDKGSSRSIILLYSAKTPDELVYRDVFDKATAQGVRTIYFATEPFVAPEGWNGRKGMIDAETIKKEVPDFKDRTFYLSGPRSMVVAFEDELSGMGVRTNRIKKDYFPGFA